MKTEKQISTSAKYLYSLSLGCSPDCFKCSAETEILSGTARVSWGELKSMEQPGPDESFPKSGRPGWCHGCTGTELLTEPTMVHTHIRGAEKKITGFRAILRFKAVQKARTILNLQRGMSGLKGPSNSSFLPVLWAPRTARICLIL